MSTCESVTFVGFYYIQFYTYHIHKLSRTHSDTPTVWKYAHYKRYVCTTCSCVHNFQMLIHKIKQYICIYMSTVRILARGVSTHSPCSFQANIMYFATNSPTAFPCLNSMIETMWILALCPRPLCPSFAYLAILLFSPSFSFAIVGNLLRFTRRSEIAGKCNLQCTIWKVDIFHTTLNIIPIEFIQISVSMCFHSVHVVFYVLIFSDRKLYGGGKTTVVKWFCLICFCGMHVEVYTVYT